MTIQEAKDELFGYELIPMYPSDKRDEALEVAMDCMNKIELITEKVKEYATEEDKFWDIVAILKKI